MQEHPRRPSGSTACPNLRYIPPSQPPAPHLAAQNASDGLGVGLDAVILQLHQGGPADVHADGAADALHGSHQILRQVLQALRVDQQPVIHGDLGRGGQDSPCLGATAAKTRSSQPCSTAGNLGEGKKSPRGT